MLQMQELPIQQSVGAGVTLYRKSPLPSQPSLSFSWSVMNTPASIMLDFPCAYSNNNRAYQLRTKWG